MVNNKRKMIDKVYSDKIIKYAANIPLQTRLKNPDITVSKRSIFCGSQIEIDVTIKSQIITGFGQTIKACALGSTTASIVAQNIIGASFDEIKLAHQEMLDMLKQGGGRPSGRFTELMLLESVKDFPNRHVSTMLVLDALIIAIEKN